MQILYGMLQRPSAPLTLTYHSTLLLSQTDFLKLHWSHLIHTSASVYYNHTIENKLVKDLPDGTSISSAQLPRPQHISRVEDVGR